jgi:hypothetical protein
MNTIISRRRKSKLTSKRRIYRKSIRRSPKRKSVRRKSRRQSSRKSRRQSRRKSVRRKSRRQSRRKSVRRKSVRRKSRRQSSRKSVKRSRKGKSRRQSSRKSIRRSPRRKSVKRKYSRQSKANFGFSRSPHYLCVLNKNGAYKCNKYPDRKTCESYGAKCTSNKSQCMNKCKKFSVKLMEKIPSYKCDPIKKICIKYNTLPKCMSSLTNVENTAGIMCSTDLNDCKTKCSNLISRMKGKTGPVISNKKKLDRLKTVRDGKNVFRELRNQQVRQKTILDRQKTMLDDNKVNKKPIRKEKMD